MVTMLGCEEEQFFPIDEVLSDAPNELVLGAPDITSANVIASKVLQRQILDVVLPKKGGRSGGQKNADSLEVQLLRVVSGYAMNVKREDRLDNYTYYVPADNPLEIINLVITADGDSLLEGSIFTYQMTPEFAQDFNQFTTDFRFFAGTLTVSPLAKLADVYYHGIQKNGEDDETDCFEWILSQRPDRPNGGGGGSNGSDSGPTVSTGDGPIGGTYGGLCVEIESVPCSCHPAHEPGEHCACGTGNDSNPDHHQPYEVITFVRCDEENGDQLTDASYGNENKNLDPEDCPELLSSIGVVARELNYPQAGSRLTEAVEAAVSETCFSLPAVMHIINLDTFANCIAGGVANGPDCVVLQIEAYLNGLNIIPQRPDGGPSPNSFSGLPHDQLAAFLNAAVAGEGNEHVYAGIGSAFLNGAGYFTSPELHETMILLSVISNQVDNTASFPMIGTSFVNILNKLQYSEEIDEDALYWLANQPSLIVLTSSVFNDLPQEYLANDVARILNDLSGLSVQLPSNESLTGKVWNYILSYGIDGYSVGVVSKFANGLAESGYSSEEILFIEELVERDNSITREGVDCDVNPCLCNVIDYWVNTSMATTLDYNIRQIFGGSSSNNLEIATSDNTSTSISSTSWAETNATGPPDGSGLPGSRIEIVFNANKPLNCSEVFLASTLIHEALHAFISQQRVALSPSEFANQFPLYSTGNGSNSGSHEVMANKYVSAMASDLLTLFPELNPQTAIQLSWGGLQRTNIYQNNNNNVLGFHEGVVTAESVASDCVEHTTAERNALGIRRCGN